MKYVHDGPYRALLDEVANDLAGVNDLAGFELAVHVVPIDDGRVARVVSPRRIDVDPSRFERAFDWERRMHVLHETAHAWRRDRGVHGADDERECFEADNCVLGWGLGVPFIDARGASLDGAYAAVLAAVATEGREKAEPLLEEWLRRRSVLGSALGHFRT